MPRIISNIPFDITGVDLYWYNEFQIDSNVDKGINVIYNGISYPDVAWIEAREQIGEQIWHYEMSFGGHGLTGSNGVLTAGRVTGFIERNLETGGITFAVDQFDVAATSVSSVFSTESSSDEIALIQSLLGGDDEFHLSPFNDRAFGLGGNDVMNGGDGVDYLDGGAGNDVIDGGTGIDQLVGGSGDDTFIVRELEDTLIEEFNGGRDTVRSSVTYELGDNIERLELVAEGSTPIHGTGNALDNEIIGNATANELRGESGDDVLEGHGGDDKLWGGDWNDTLTGGDGSDDLYGGAGDDILYAQIGDSAGEWDRLDGGTGADQFFVNADDHVHAFDTDDVSIVFNTSHDVGRIAIVYDGSTEIRGYSSDFNYESMWIDEGVRPIFLSASAYSGIGQGIILQHRFDPPPELYEFAINQQSAEEAARNFVEESLTQFKRDTLKARLEELLVDGAQGAVADFLARRGGELAKEAIEKFFAEVNIVVSGAEFADSVRTVFQKYLDGDYDGQSHVAAQDLGMAISDLVIPVPGAGAAFKLGTDLASDLIARVAFAFSESITITYDELQNGVPSDGSEGNDILIQEGDQQTYYFGAGDDILFEIDRPASTQSQGLMSLQSVSTAAAGQGQTYDGQTGTDTVAYDVTGAMRVNLSLGVAERDGASTDTLVSIENVSTGDGADEIVGSSEDNSLWANAGDDTITGGAGDDFLDGGAGTDTAIYAGDRSNYEITLGDSGLEVVSAAEGADLLTGIEFLEFDGVTYSVADLDTPSVPPTPVSSQFTLVTVSDFTGAVGGDGRVVGTAGTERITVEDVAGVVRFDASFNRGGDAIRLSGDASDYNVWTSSSSIFIDDGDTQIVVPVGPTGADIVFDDGVRTITYSTDAGPLLGDQAVTASATQILAAPGAGTVDGIGDPTVQGRLIVAEDGTAVAGGNLRVIGTPGAETISILNGSSAVFDASANRGGDNIELAGVAGDFTAAMAGSYAEISSESISVLIPVGLNVTTIAFADGDYSLFVDQELGGAVLGETVLGSDPTHFASSSTTTTQEDFAFA